MQVLGTSPAANCFMSQSCSFDKGDPSDFAQERPPRCQRFRQQVSKKAHLAQLLYKFYLTSSFPAVWFICLEICEELLWTMSLSSEIGHSTQAVRYIAVPWYITHHPYSDPWLLLWKKNSDKILPCGAGALQIAKVTFSPLKTVRGEAAHFTTICLEIRFKKM